MPPGASRAARWWSVHRAGVVNGQATGSGSDFYWSKLDASVSLIFWHLCMSLPDLETSHDFAVRF